MFSRTPSSSKIANGKREHPDPAGVLATFTLLPPMLPHILIALYSSIATRSPPLPILQVEITELQVRKWTQEYKQFLESLLPGAEDLKAKAGAGKKGDKDKAAKDKAPVRNIKDFKENHTDTT